MRFFWLINLGNRIRVSLSTVRVGLELVFELGLGYYRKLGQPKLELNPNSTDTNSNSSYVNPNPC